MADIFDFIDLSVKADKEKGRQKAEFSRLGVAPPAEANIKKDVFDLISPQDIAAKTGGGYAPPAMPSQSQVLETLNAPIDYLGDVAGRKVQSWVDPNKNPNLSDIAGGLTKAAIQYASPQGVSTAARLGTKALLRFTPGAQAGQMESLIGKTEQKLQSGLQEAKQSEGVSRRLADISESETAPLPNTLAKVNAIIAQEEAHGIKSSPIRADAERLKGLIEKSGTQNMKWFDRELTIIGQKTKAVMDQPADPRYKQIFGSLATDLESKKRITLGRHTEYGQPSVSMIGQPASKETIKTGSYTDWGKPSVSTIGEKATKEGERFIPSSQTSLIEWGKPKQVAITKEAHLPSTKTPMIQWGDPKQVEEIAKPSGRGAAVLSMREAERRRLGFEDVIDEFNKMVTTKRGTAGAQDINANRLQDKLRRNNFLQESLKPEDWKELEPLITKLADTAALPAGRGASYGSGRALARGALAAGTAALLGGNPYTWGAGITALDYSVGHLLMTKKGRSLVKAVLEAKAYEPSQQLNIINGMGRLAEKGISDAQRANQ